MKIVSETLSKVEFFQKKKKMAQVVRYLACYPWTSILEMLKKISYIKLVVYFRRSVKISKQHSIIIRVSSCQIFPKRKPFTIDRGGFCPKNITSAKGGLPS